MEGDIGMCYLKTPFLRLAIFLPLWGDHSNPFLSYRNHFNFFCFLNYFQAQFWLILPKFTAPCTQILVKIYSKNSSFKQKNQSWRLYFYNLGSTHLPKITLVPQNYIMPYKVILCDWFPKIAH